MKQKGRVVQGGAASLTLVVRGKETAVFMAKFRKVGSGSARVPQWHLSGLGCVTTSRQTNFTLGKEKTVTDNQGQKWKMKLKFKT